MEFKQKRRKITFYSRKYLWENWQDIYSAVARPIWERKDCSVVGMVPWDSNNWSQFRALQGTHHVTLGKSLSNSVCFNSPSVKQEYASLRCENRHIKDAMVLRYYSNVKYFRQSEFCGGIQ